jgi:hemoglobin
MNTTKLSTTITVVVLAAALSTVIGCGGGGGQKKKDEFFTSGSREADQRATQRMAREQQLAGGQRDQKQKTDEGRGGTASGANTVQGERKRTLFERLGGEQGITAIVDDFTVRAVVDPRVNWERKGMKRTNIFGRGESVAWQPTAENLAQLKTHLVQFLAVATGGPPKYEGKGIRAAHQGMRISNPEFDAAIGDLKASLDKLGIADREQKELLAIIESTRPQIVTER